VGIVQAENEETHPCEHSKWAERCEYGEEILEILHAENGNNYAVGKFHAINVVWEYPI
jgi:hypothetical protein